MTSAKYQLFKLCEEGAFIYGVVQSTSYKMRTSFELLVN